MNMGMVLFRHLYTLPVFLSCEIHTTCVYQALECIKAKSDPVKKYHRQHGSADLL